MWAYTHTYTHTHMYLLCKYTQKEVHTHRNIAPYAHTHTHTRQLSADIQFLESHGLMGYSLYVGIHRKRAGFAQGPEL